MSKFQREERYVVLKISDMSRYLTEADLVKILQIESWISFQRQQSNKEALAPVVVESDWPEYETVWKMIEARVNEERENKFL